MILLTYSIRPTPTSAKEPFTDPYRNGMFNLSYYRPCRASNTEFLHDPPRSGAIFFVVARSLIHDVGPVLIPDRNLHHKVL